MGLAHPGPAPSWRPFRIRTPVGVHRSTVPAPLSFLQSWTRGPGGQLGRMPVQGTNGQAHCQLQEAVSCARAGLQAGGPACLRHGGWRQEVGAQNTTFPGSGPGPRASFGREGRALATPSLAGPWLSPSSAWLSPCSPPSSLRQSAHSWQRHPFNLLPRKPDGQAGLLSQPRDGKQGGGPPQASLARIPWGLDWEIVLRRLGFPGSGIISAQLAALSNQAEPRAWSSWNWGRAGETSLCQESDPGQPLSGGPG